jgi:sn-glycerol 3-phosphate transport system substrate-binding protein
MKLKRLSLRLLSTFVLSATALASAAHAETRLTMYYPIAVGGPLTQVMDGLIKQFHQANPDIDVDAVYAGNYDETRVRAISAARSGGGAQIAVLGALDTHDLIDQGLIEPFDTIPGIDKQWLGGFYPALMANSTVDGHAWGVPFQRSTIVMYYNKDMFRAAGLDPNKPPRTWAEMVSDAKTLTTKDHYGLMIPSTGYAYWMFQAIAIEQGIELANQAGTKVQFNNPGAVKALTAWRALAADDKVSPPGAIDWGTLRQSFVQGQTAMMWHTTGNLTAVKKDAKFDFGVAMLPGVVRAGSPTGGGNFYLFKGADAAQRKAALAFIQWMTSPEQAARWSMATGYVGTSDAAYQTDALRDYSKSFPQALVARDQLQVAIPELSTHASARVREALSNGLQSALTGTATPQQALDTAQSTADRILKAYQ